MGNPGDEHQAALADWRERANALKAQPDADDLAHAEAQAADAERAARQKLSEVYDKALEAYRANPSEANKTAYRAAAEAIAGARLASRTADAEVAGRPPGMVVTGTQGGVS